MMQQWSNALETYLGNELEKLHLKKSTYPPLAAKDPSTVLFYRLQHPEGISSIIYDVFQKHYILVRIVPFRLLQHFRVNWEYQLYSRILIGRFSPSVSLVSPLVSLSTRLRASVIRLSRDWASNSLGLVSALALILT